MAQLSICITVKNRSRLEIGPGKYLSLFPNCIDSLSKAINPEDDVEVIIADWGSDDLPLMQWIFDFRDHLNLKIIHVDGPFHRGTGRNMAADHATSDHLFFLDADILVSRPVILNGISLLKQKKAYFPTCFYFIDEGHSYGFWCFGGRGVCFLTKEMFSSIGRWPCPPQYIREVDEDQKLFQMIEKLQIPYLVQREDNFYHQYHPGRSVDIINKRQRHLIERSPNRF